MHFTFKCSFCVLSLFFVVLYDENTILIKLLVMYKVYNLQQLKNMSTLGLECFFPVSCKIFRVTRIGLIGLGPQRFLTSGKASFRSGRAFRLLIAYSST